VKQYCSLSDFYEAYEEGAQNYGLIPIKEIDRLIARLREEGYSIRELKDSRVVVRTPEEMKASHIKRRAKQAEGASRFSKLGASFPKEKARQFAEACRVLGYTQSETLMPVVEETILKAKLIGESK
jgi:hypothetical protein